MEQLTPIKNITHESDFKDRLVKLIPGEVVVAYLTIDGLIPPGNELAKWVALGVAIVLLLAIPLYMRKIYGTTSRKQIGLTMCSFVIWLYSLGGPFKLWTIGQVPLYIPFVASILLVLWTFLMPVIATEPSPDAAKAGQPALQGR